MISLRATSIVILITSGALRGQVTTTVAGRAQDLNFVQNILPRLHADFLYQLSPAAYAQAAANLAARISTTTDAEFYTGLAQLIAMAGDMHTTLSPGVVFNTSVLPLSVYWLDDGLFVTAAAPEYAQAIGTQIVGVNGMTIAQVTTLLGTVFAYSNPQWLHEIVIDHITHLFLLQGLDIIPYQTTVPMTFQTLAGDQFTLTIAPAPGPYTTMPAAAETTDYLQDPNSAYYWYEYIAANRMMYVRYLVCEDDPNGVPVSTFSSQILTALDANPVDTFVIDFRQNGGGNEYLLFPLGAGLLQRLATLQQNPKFHIYLVIDEGTFSSGMYTPMAFVSGFMAQYEHLNLSFGNTISVIGEPTGGKPIEFAQTMAFTLPYSQAPGDYSTAFINQNEGVIPDLPSFYPDIPVGTRSTDYFPGYDPVMGAILARSSGAIALPTGTILTESAASFRSDQGIAPGSLAAGFGSFFAPPDQLLVNGQLAQIVSSSTSLVNFVVPPSTGLGLANVVPFSNGQGVAAGQVTITPSSPGIFILNPADPTQPGAVENQDASVNSPDNPASASQVVSIYATGSAPLNPDGSAPVQAFFGDVPGQVQYSAPVAGIPGLWLINVTVPKGLPSGQQPVFLISGAAASNAVTISIQ